MKKIISILILSILILMNIYTPVNAIDEGMNQLRLTVVEADEDYEIYILLPKNYIKYAISYDGLDIEYNGAETLKNNIIPSIVVDINNVQDETYIDELIEYVQIKLDDLGGEEYVFDIIAEYTNMDMMFRIKSETKNDLMVLDKFTIEDNTCKMEYNYKENTIKSEKKNDFTLNFNLKWWQILIIIVLVIFIIYISKRRNY